MPGNAAPSDTPAADAPAADASAPVADTSLTGAPEGGGQSSEAGDGGASTEAGQGAGNETTPDGGASASGDESQAGEGGDALGAPEQYADFALPEGFELPTETRDSLTTFAKAHNLNQEQAQALVDLGVAQATAITRQFTEQALANPVLLAEHWAGEWSKQTAADPELGGSDAKLKTTMALATRVFATFASPAFGDFLNQTGLAHHPEMIRFMRNVGGAVSEDTLVTPQGGSKRGGVTGVDRLQQSASKLYPSMK